MQIKTNPDKSVVDMVRKALENNGGYCPCQIPQSKDTKCICRDFREKIEDENFTGFCHCSLYQIIR